MTTHIRLLAPRPIAVATALLLAACGRGDGGNQAADSPAAASPTTTAATAADSATLAPPVGSQKPIMDSAIARGNATIDSLKAAGETPASGIAKGIQPAVHAANNDSSPRAHSLKVKPTNVP